MFFTNAIRFISKIVFFFADWEIEVNGYYYKRTTIEDTQLACEEQCMEWDGTLLYYALFDDDARK